MDTLNAMDEDTATFILQILIEDIIKLSDRWEGKGETREGTPTDEQTALQLYKADLELNVSIIRDRKMTRSIARACEADSQLLATSLSQEQDAAADREVACRLGGIATPPPTAPWTVTSEFLDDDLMAKMAVLYASPLSEGTRSKYGSAIKNDYECNETDSSSWAATSAPNHEYRYCTACQEEVIFYDSARVPCGHEYCRECLSDLFRTSMTDDSLFPPRCCRVPITTGGVRIFLPTELIKKYEAKKIEFDTPNRTYCSNPTCSSFIRLEHVIEERATCPDCKTVTCSMCKAGAHTGDCPADAGLQLVLQTANENGWQRCFNCRRLVELDVGCNHMTCHCGSQFCYLCGLEWKTCLCRQWDENRLIRRAEQIVARGPVLDQPQQQAQVAAAVRNLRDHHNCDHENWQYVRGQHQCEECHDILPGYIFECRQCNIQACNRCRRSRL